MHLLQVYRIVPLICLGLFLQNGSPSVVAAAQALRPAVSIGYGHAVPIDHLYWHFLEHQLYIDNIASNIDQKGGDGRNLRAHYQTQLGFDDSQFSIIRQSATRLDEDLRQIDARAKAIIDNFHKQYLPGKVTSLPPASPQLTLLQQQREAIIANAVADLKLQLGSKATSTVDYMLTTEFAPKVTFTPLAKPNAEIHTNTGGIFTSGASDRTPLQYLSWQTASIRAC